ncbi:hypothetical protein KCP77_06830 [Salmonella enterica subsp. enterica]|nr:hypothetical protein KCP77_06830 [Salmonella enterica subsp. enterica]
MDSHSSVLLSNFAALKSRRLRMVGSYLNNDDAAREELGARAAQVHQHTVMTRNRDNLHFSDYSMS